MIIINATRIWRPQLVITHEAHGREPNTIGIETAHRIRRGDARDLHWLPDESVHLTVTSPPYWTLKEYPASNAQLGNIKDYEEFLDELNSVWAHVLRVLVPGGRMVCVVGDVCVARRK